MPMTPDMLIDVALNMAGYLAAGALSMVIYSIFRRTPRPASPAETEHRTAPLERPAAPAKSAGRTRADAQFVGFGERTSASDGGQSLTLRRNRAEVLRLARGMLGSGASEAEVKAVLPVSDAELAVLNYERA